MTYFTTLEPFTIRDHNEEALREVSKLRLEKRLREARQPRSGRHFALTFRGILSLPREAIDAAKAIISVQARQ